MNEELKAERQKLVDAEFASYNPENFPGSKGWWTNKRAADALAEFDAKYPEIAAEAEADLAAARKPKTVDEMTDDEIEKQWI